MSIRDDRDFIQISSRFNGQILRQERRSRPHIIAVGAVADANEKFAELGIDDRSERARDSVSPAARKTSSALTAL